MQRMGMAAAAMILVLSGAEAADEATGVSKIYRALKCPAPLAASTWAIMDRDGGNRPVDPYLSSLGQGESGRGTVVSPPFTIDSDTITFTLCGHDGMGGGRGENFLALVDLRKGRTLEKTPAPGNDAMQTLSWDVSRLKGTEVRIEAHDGNAEGAYAWFGIGRIDAGESLRVDFRQGLPEGWQTEGPPMSLRSEVVSGGLPFRRYANIYTLMPRAKTAEIPCGFKAKRLFVLGATVAGGKLLDECGAIEVLYAGGAQDTIPLVVGFTLDAQYKQFHPSPALRLHPTEDPFQHYFVIDCRDAVIEEIRLVPHPDAGNLPQITAITCETDATAETLEELPDAQPAADEKAWILKNAISAEGLTIAKVRQEVQRGSKAVAPPSRAK